MTSGESRHRWVASPYLHFHDHVILNPHTGRGIADDDPAFEEIKRLFVGGIKLQGGLL